MTLGPRIESRLQAIGLSQAELARRIGVRQSTMNSLIRGNSRTSRSIVQIARELETTPAYLLGETDDPNVEFPDDHSVSPEELRWVELIRLLQPNDRSALLQVTRSLATVAPQSQTLHNDRRAYKAEA